MASGKSAPLWIFWLLAVGLLTNMPALAERYDHPSGLGFNYPAKWTLTEDERFLVLIPPGSTPNLNSEVVLIGTEPMEGVNGLLDPAVVGWFDTQLAGLLGDAKRVAAPLGQRNGVLLRYSTGDGRNHRVFYKELQGLGAYVAHIGATTDREAAVEQVFTSFGGQLARDPQLVGSWYRNATSMSDVDYDSSGGASYVSSSASMQYVFGADNKVRYESSSAVYGQGSAGGGTSSVSTSGANPADHGTYSANGKRLTILWDNGETTEKDYNVFETNDGPALKLVDPVSGQHAFWRRN